MTLQIPIFGRSTHERDQQKFRRQLRPAGHNAFAEWMVGFITPVGSTAMVVIACYVLAQEELARMLAGTGQGSDYFVTGLVFVLGAMVDTAVIVTASRFKMHVARGQREIPWAIITGTMLFLCLSVEAMTLMYFAWLVSPASVPVYIVSAVKHIHDILFFIRNGLPPVIIAFFTTCLMPLSVETSDRDRAAKASSSLNIAALQEELVAVGSTATPEEKLTALENQIAINEHASRATTDEHERNIALINQLRMNYGLAPRAQHDALTAATAQEMIQQALTQFDADSPLGQFIREALAQQQEATLAHVQTMVAATSPLVNVEESLATWAGQIRTQLEQQFQRLVAPLQQQMRDLAAVVEGDAGQVVIANSGAAAPSVNPVQSKPGTRRFNQLVYETAQRLLTDGHMTIFNIAQSLKVDPQVIQDALAALRQERLRKLRPGKELDPDPVLDTL